MSIMEKLFMRIFDRKRLFEDQLKHQVESYGESLASNLLSEGQCPPPWLLTFESGNSIWPQPKGKMEAEEISRITPVAKKMCTAVQTRYFSAGNNNKHDAHDITWPKRKKMKNQSHRALATSPRLRAKADKHVEGHLDCIHRISLDNVSGSSVDFQPSMLSPAAKVELSEAALGSHYDDEHPE